MTRAELTEHIECAMARYFSGNNMPHMSGDDRNRCSPGQRRMLSDAATAALAAIEAAGWVCVPREPTRIMLNRGMEAYINWRAAKDAECLDEREVSGIWKDMLAAAPRAEDQT